MNDRFGEARLNPEPLLIPKWLEHLWDWFWLLHRRRHSGPEPLSYRDISEWASITGTLIEAEEVDVLIAMDDAYLEAVRDEKKAVRSDKPGSKSSASAGRPANKKRR